MDKVAFREKCVSIITACIDDIDFMHADLDYYPLNINCGEMAYCFTLSILDDLYPEDGWDRRVIPYLQTLIEQYKRTPFMSPGLFSGQAGICWCVRNLSRQGTRYVTAIRQLDERLRSIVLNAAEKLRNDSIVASEEYDIISGLSGSLLYCLHYMGDNRLLESTAYTAYDALAGHWDEYGADGFGSLMAVESPKRKAMTDAVTDLGFAHGILGVIAVLSMGDRLLTDMSTDVSPYSQEFRRLVELSEKNSLLLPYGSLRSNLSSADKKKFRYDQTDGRFAWCYGNGGMATTASLWRFPILQRQLVGLVNKPLQRPNLYRIDNYGICHGWAGIYLTCLPYFSSLTRRMVEKQVLLGVSQIDRDAHRYGFLDGALGTCVTALCVCERKVPGMLFPFTGV